MTNKQLLVVSHSRTGGTVELVDAAVEAARSPEIEGIDVRCIDALRVTPQDAIDADGYLLASPENFGAMSGALKYFFETIFHPCELLTRGRPFGLIIKAGHDGTGALASIEPITTGLRWRLVLPPVVVVGTVTSDHLDQASELGGSLAAGIALGVF